METKFTKGEWNNEEVENEKGSYFKINAYNISICNITTRDQNLAKANAKLISCSPEMFILLNEAEQALEWYMENTNPIDENWQTFHDLGMNIRVGIEAIIKKATE